jgi:DNA-binding LacI/PurR family transcriptional regulator
MSVSKPRKADAVTMSDIAQLAGVSRPTVSIVLNDRHEAVGISADTVDRVIKAASKLGYRRNALALAVKTGRSLTLGFLAGEADLEYSSRAFSGILDEADEHEYTVKRFRLYDRPEDSKVIERCSEHRLDGIIVNDAGLAVSVDIIRREFEAQNVPVVWLDPKGLQSWGVQVRPGDEEGTVLAVRHLVELGHTRIAFIGGTQNIGTGVPRVAGFRRGMEQAGLDCSLVFWTDWDMTTTRQVFDDVMALPDAPTALLCGSDAMALEYLRRLRAIGKRVPQDVSVVGFGDLARVELADPALTTVHVPYVEMGRGAVQQLLHMLATPEEVQAHKEIVFPTHLVVRESSGMAPGVQV